MNCIRASGRWIAALCSVALAGCAGANLAPVAAPAPAPDLRAGDAWTYVVYDGFRGYEKGKRRYAVKRIDGDVVTVEVTGFGGDGTRTFTRGWNPLDGKTPAGDAVTYQPPLPLYAFPLANGGRWNQAVTATLASGQGRFPVYVQSRVLGAEKVTTPAGAFDTVVVERSLRIGDGETSVWRSDTRQVVTEWYAPAVNRSVRFREDENFYLDKMTSGPLINRQKDWDRERLELIEYTRGAR